MSTIAIGFNDKFEKSSQVTVQLSEALQEHEPIWVWDHFFSFVMHRLSTQVEAENLLNILSEWATAFANKMYAPINELHAEKALVIDPKLQLLPELSDTDEIFWIEVTDIPESWPGVNVKVADKLNPKRLAFAVIALAQYFLKTNTSFFRELPMHILAMRKFYLDEIPYSDQDSIAEAPAFAFNTALKFYQSLEQKIHQP